MRPKVLGGAALVLMLAASAALAFWPDGTGEYTADAGPAIRALVDGNLSEFFARQPLMGSFSLLVRAPFAALAGIGDGSELLVYRLGALPSLAAAGLLGLYIARLMGRQGRSPLAVMLVGALVLVNPLTFDALSAGHPEEILGAALSVGAVVVATRGRSLGAGLLLGLALGTKQWAILAVLPVLLAASGQRPRILLASGAVAAALTLPLAVGNQESFTSTANLASSTPSIVGRFNVWWPLVPSERRTIFNDTVDEMTVTVRALPPWLRRATHPLIVLLAVPLSFLYWRRRRDLRREDALALLALLFLLRSVLDPVNNAYYHEPFLLSLIAWEGLRLRRLPLLSMLAATALWGTFHNAVPALDPALTNAVYLSWTVPLVGLLGAWLYAPRLVGALAGRLRLSQPLFLR